jgi:hypothetical protein
MKYILKKKWHPSQVEEVGHVFEEDKYGYTFYQPTSMMLGLAPHEIALLVDAGYLEKQEEKCVHGTEITKTRACLKCYTGDEPTLDLWTTEPPEGTQYWSLRYSENSEGGTVRVDWYIFSKTMILFHLYNLRTNNCHSTKASAEEALRRLLER